MRTFVRTKETPQVEGNPRVVTIYGELRERKINGVRTKEFAMGWSICNPQDKFDEAFGEKLAKSRLNWKKALTTTNGSYLCPDMCECLMDNEVDYVSENWQKFIFPKKGGVEKKEYVVPETTEVTAEPETIEPKKIELTEDELHNIVDRVVNDTLKRRERKSRANKSVEKRIEQVADGTLEVKDDVPATTEWGWTSKDGKTRIHYKGFGGRNIDAEDLIGSALRGEFGFLNNLNSILGL